MLGMICDDQGKNPGKENSFKNWPTQWDLESRLRHITARHRRINTRKTKKTEEISLKLWVLNCQEARQLSAFII